MSKIPAIDWSTDSLWGLQRRIWMHTISHFCSLGIDEAAVFHAQGSIHQHIFETVVGFKNIIIVHLEQKEYQL